MTKKPYAPTPAEIRAARANAKHTQSDMANKLNVTTRTVNRWEAGAADMPYPHWQWYQVITGQHTDYKLKCRPN
jgi:DNA-binding transcriptional regulator YiaG